MNRSSLAWAFAAAALWLAIGAVAVLAVDVKSCTLDTVEDVVSCETTKGKIWSYDYTGDLPLSQADLDAVRDQAQQDLFDDDLARNVDLPADDPDRLADPANECAYWYSRTSGPPTQRPRIVYRNTIVVAAYADANGDPYLELRNCDTSNPAP